MDSRRRRSPQAGGHRSPNDTPKQASLPQHGAYFGYQHGPVDPSNAPPRSLPPPSWGQHPGQQYAERSYQVAMVPSNHPPMAAMHQYPPPPILESQMVYQNPQHQLPLHIGAGPPSSYAHSTTGPHRRTFRSRRKDPSCDSCRERKVKCDATESTSCSECGSRGVRCQFTKETNRRMSSSRTVQDLERQLAEQKEVIKQLSEVRHGDSNQQPMDLDFPQTPQSTMADSRPSSVRLPPQAQWNIRQFSNGIFDAPFDMRKTKSSRSPPLSSHRLPAKPAVDRLLQFYFYNVHQSYTVFDWASFTDCCDKVYQRGSFASVNSGWVALFYSILSVSTLLAAESSSDPLVFGLDGRHLIEQATKILREDPNDLAPDHCHAALLASIYYVEVNERSSGRKYLAFAIEYAYELGLQEDCETLPMLDSEYRRRICWWIYSWDRLESLQISKPLLVQDDEYNTMRSPRPMAEVYAEIYNDPPPPPKQILLTPLELIIPLSRMALPLRKALKNQTVPVSTLQAIDAQLDSIVMAWPDPLRPGSHAYLDPNLLPVAALFPCMTLLLHRHNLTPASIHGERTAALENCYQAANLTKHLINRTFQPHPMVPTDGYTDPQRASLSWEQRVVSSTSAHLCAHLWRCILILCLCLDFESAMICAQVSAAIGSRRKINIACSRNVRFFLTEISGRLNIQANPEISRADLGTLRRPLRLDQDEEMIAYATGDLQGDLRGSWVWSGGDADGASSNEGERKPGRQRRSSEDYDMNRNSTIEEDNNEWPRVMSMFQTLRPYQRQQPPRLSSGGSSGDARSRSGYSPTGSSKRISIANII